jgi:hypothetical protein
VMGGGREIPTLTPTCAIAGAGTTIANAKNTVHKSSFFIVLPPCLVFIRKRLFPTSTASICGCAHTSAPSPPPFGAP